MWWELLQEWQIQHGLAVHNSESDASNLWVRKTMLSSENMTPMRRPMLTSVRITPAAVIIHVIWTRDKATRHVTTAACYVHCQWHFKNCYRLFRKYRIPGWLEGQGSQCTTIIHSKVMRTAQEAQVLAWGNTIKSVTLGYANRTFTYPAKMHNCPPTIELYCLVWRGTWMWAPLHRLSQYCKCMNCNSAC